ncbi:MAG: NUDIX hydrolase [Gemmatimonadetes bacterium]|nr:NUDIX hydrolase [Gemmatimonadota bacterium]
MSERPPSRGKRGALPGRRARNRTRIETSAGGVVYRRAERAFEFLLIRDPYQNWGLPKGHVEQDETPVQAALREVAEETGLTDLEPVAEIAKIDWYFHQEGQLVHKFCHFFLMESRSGEARPQVEEGISECVWLPLDQAMETVTYENAREVLRAAGQRLG